MFAPSTSTVKLRATKKLADLTAGDRRLYRRVEGDHVVPVDG
jgi:hypothetical protein